MNLKKMFLRVIQVQLQEGACFHQDLWPSEEFEAQKLINLLQSINGKKRKKLGKSLVLVKSVVEMSFFLVWSGFSPVSFICHQYNPDAVAFWLLLHLRLFLFKLLRLCSKYSKISILISLIFNKIIWMWQYHLICADMYEWTLFIQNFSVNIGQQYCSWTIWMLAC